ncbi:hypothetical protein [Streptomyces sp. NPDC095613]|uniref:hypothetical protein n=1 Tax=Streptomyces sp. NPDC095613 TaxID=3155540 RepID=UPI00332C9A39
MNDALDGSRDGGDEQAARKVCEARWNTLHGIRTVFAVAAFAAVAVAQRACSHVEDCA